MSHLTYNSDLNSIENPRYARPDDDKEVKAAPRQSIEPERNKTFLHRASFSFVTLLPHKTLLAVAVVVDVALQVERRRVSADTLASRHGLGPRYLEPMLLVALHSRLLFGSL
jgi:hypothetical protein